MPTEAGKWSIGKQSNQTLFCRLTPELSRPVAGRRVRASVAQKHAADATTWGRLERIVRRLADDVWPPPN